MKVLAIGSGHRVRAELARIDRAAFDVVIGVNRAAIEFGPVDWHCTLHPREYAPIKAARLVSHLQMPGVDRIFPAHWRHGQSSSGSSGLYAVRWALQIGAGAVTLAGIGMDGHHFDKAAEWSDAERFRRMWVELAPDLRGIVTSLGGWTAELLNN